MTARIMAILVSASLVSAGAYGASATRAADVVPGLPSSLMAESDSGGTDKCRVDVLRSGQAGVAKVTRDTLPDGSCVCSVTTGPQAINGAAEEVVTALLRDRTCDGAPSAGEIGSGQSAGGGGSGGVLGGLVGAIAVGGLAVGLGGKSKG